jgi:hypothetical protein
MSHNLIGFHGLLQGYLYLFLPLLKRNADITRNNRGGCVCYVVRATPSAANGQINSQCDTWHVFSMWSAPCNNRGAVFSVRGPCAIITRNYWWCVFFPLVAPTPGSLLPLLEHRAEFPQFLDQGQSVGLIGRVISSSQGLYLYTNTEKRAHIHKH